MHLSDPDDDPLIQCCHGSLAGLLAFVVALLATGLLGVQPLLLMLAISVAIGTMAGVAGYTFCSTFWKLMVIAGSFPIAWWMSPGWDKFLQQTLDELRSRRRRQAARKSGHPPTKDHASRTADEDSPGAIR